MKVSLIIPAYNVENLIEMTLESVKNQTFKSFECIIVNDFSTDNTDTVIREFIKTDKRFKIIVHRANAGLSAARNSGLRFAKGKYVAFLDSDDLLMTNSLELRMKTLEENIDNRVIGTYAGSVTIGMNSKIAPTTKKINLKDIDFITAGGSCPFNANQPMFITEVLKKIGGFDHSLKQAEDYDMWMRVLRYGYKIIPTNYQLVTYRQTEGSMIRNNPLLHLDTSYEKFMNCYESYSNIKFSNKLNTQLSESLATYVSQLHIANRVLEFIGLGLAKGEDLALLEKKLIEYLPQYFQIIESHRPFIGRVKKGIDRYYKKNIDLKAEEHREINIELNKLYINFKKNSSNKIVDYNVITKKIKYSFQNIVANPGIQNKIDLIFIPHKDYHVYTISLIKKYLEIKGITFIILDISMHYRDERAISACREYDLPYIGYSNFILGNFNPKAFVVFNDWDPIVRSILIEAKKENIPTIGIVEGIQDYLDADTKQDRETYKTVDYLFLPGEHDKKYFKEKKSNIFVGGIPRIFDLYSKNKNSLISKKNNKIALINSNFSYGVLEEFRDEWLVSAVNACKIAGYTPVISKHPADKGELFTELVTSESFYNALENSSVLISRFASGILESLAFGIVPIYYNPHQEKVDKFYDSLGAYPIANNEKELIESLTNLEKNLKTYKLNFKNFLNYHCGNLEIDNSKYIANEISNIINNVKYLNFNNYDNFFSGLYKLDKISGCFNNLQVLRKLNKEPLIKNEIVKEKITITSIYEYIKEQNYEQAKIDINELILKDSFNPSYLSILNTINILSKSEIERLTT